MVYIFRSLFVLRVCSSNVDDFNNRNLFDCYELIVKYNVGLKTLLQQGISEPIIYGGSVYKFKRIVEKPNFSDQFKKIIKRYKKGSI